MERLKQLDEEASLMFAPSDRIRIIIAGGGALVLMEYISRMTHDIDVLAVEPRCEVQQLMEHYDLNMDVISYSHFFPFNYEDRLVPVDIDGSMIDFYTISLEDAIISKLCSPRDKDFNDITSPRVLASIDWDVLERLATSEDELRSNLMSDFRYREFLDAYHEYVRRFRP